MKIATLPELEKYLANFLPISSDQKYPGKLALARAKYLMCELGNPQDDVRVVHIAGTAGKTSTAYLISALLMAHGFKVGLHASPYIVSINERFQINNAYLEPDIVVSIFNEMIPILDKMKGSQFGTPSYFEVTIALAYLIFKRLNVDYAVVETGVGGMYDATNTVNSPNKCAVITPIGLDHMDVLGNTIEEIAIQKAGIIGTNNLVISCLQEKAALAQLSARVENVSAKLIYLPEVSKISHIHSSSKGTTFTYVNNSAESREIKLRLVGEYQAENAHCAIESVRKIGVRDGFELSEKVIRTAFASITIPGRFEFRETESGRIIIDGAHNEMKMRAFTQALKELDPGNKHTFLIAFKKGKNIEAMLELIIPFAQKIVVTGFSTAEQDMIHQSCDVELIVEYLKKNGFTSYEVIENPRDAFAHAKISTKSLIVTGSLYLIGLLYPDFTAL